MFEFDITFPRAGHAVRVEAEGYLPSESRIFKDDESNVSLEFKLKRGTDLAGVVRTPDGKPLAGAEVILVLPPNGACVSQRPSDSDLKWSRQPQHDCGRMPEFNRAGARCIVHAKYRQAARAARRAAQSVLARVARRHR